MAFPRHADLMTSRIQKKLPPSTAAAKNNRSRLGQKARPTLAMSASGASEVVSCA